MVRARQPIEDRCERAVHRDQRAGAAHLRPAQALGTHRRRRRGTPLNGDRPHFSHLEMKAHNAALVAHIDIAGGGQVWVEGNTLYVGHMRNPNGTSILDVSDPRNPKLLATVPMPEGWHSHKGRVANGVVIVNHERFGQDTPEFAGGLGIYHVSNPSKPKQLAQWQTAGKGGHRYSFDARYAHTSPTAEGHAGTSCMLLDWTN